MLSFLKKVQFMNNQSKKSTINITATTEGVKSFIYEPFLKISEPSTRSERLIRTIKDKWGIL